MNNLSFYNPAKVYDAEWIKAHAVYLQQLLSTTSRKVCFIGDEAGYFFSPVRRVNNPGICFTNKFFGALFGCLKSDVNMIKSLFMEYYTAFDIELLPYYERQIFHESRPEIIAYYTLILSLLSQNIDGSFSHFSTNKEPHIYESIKKLTRFSIENNDIYWAEPPKDRVIISYEKDFTGEGILITESKKDMRLINTIGTLKYYYKREER